MKEKRGFFIGDDYFTPDANLHKIRNPYNGRIVSTIHMASEKEREMALSLAFKSFEKIAMIPRADRIAILEGLAEGIEKRKEEIAGTICLEAGKPIKTARAEVERGLDTINITIGILKSPMWEHFPLDFQRGASGRYAIVERFPVGVVLGISPFNFPLNLMMHKLAPAIASGCPYIHKPASQVATTALIIGEILNQLMILPGQVAILPMTSQITEPLIEDDRIRFVSFTGSSDIGWQIKKKSGKARVSLELGGNAGCVVEPDINMDKVIDRCVMGAFSYQGQVCISLQRLYVHGSIYDKFIEKLIIETEKLVMGDPIRDETDIGPMITETDAERVLEWVDEAVDGGGKVLTGGVRNGAMVKPTIVENAPDNCRAMQEEIFGPVVMIRIYSDFDDALHSVNNTRYGLQAGIFTRDMGKAYRAYRHWQVGGVIINDVPTYRHDSMPYGGSKDSGIGREGPKYTIEEMTESRVMVVNPL